MLVLSRTRDEAIIIGDNIVVTVVDVRGDKVKLGIEAPQDVSVHRREVYEAIKKENATAQRAASFNQQAAHKDINAGLKPGDRGTPQYPLLSPDL